jgi:hypothetical protein
MAHEDNVEFMVGAENYHFNKKLEVRLNMASERAEGQGWCGLIVLPFETKQVPASVARVLAFEMPAGLPFAISQ